jgi:hypothetical protein
LERSKSLVLLQVGGLTCRWQRHSVKPSCRECLTTVEQAETQLRVVVPIEEEECKQYPNVHYSLHLTKHDVTAFSFVDGLKTAEV